MKIIIIICLLLRTTEGLQTIDYVGNPCSVAFSGGQCAECTGDCDNDGDCAGDLRCAQRSKRSGVENVPGCDWNGSRQQFRRNDYCFMPTTENAVVNYVGECSQSTYLCKLCEGDCDSDADCEGALVCAQRDGFEAVDGCSGEGGSRDVYGKDMCVNPPAPDPTPAPTPPPSPPSVTNIQYVGNPCSVAFSGGQCAECTGDCDNDGDCAGDLRCAQRSKRSGVENVPGCDWNGSSRQTGADDYCFMPTTENAVVNYVGECSQSTYLCKLCEGDCDSDADCEGALVCAQRDGFEASDGCSGEGGSRDVYGKDMCVNPPNNDPPQTSDSLTIRESPCTDSSPCPECHGSCDVDSNCEAGLECFQRGAVESIPNCVTGGPDDISGINYCYEKPPLGDVTYIPGEISVTSAGLRLSTGLSATIIARSGQSMPGSGIPFHYDPDAAAIFPITEGPNSGGWIYASNAEVSNGGVGAITFNSSGDVIDYEMIMINTSVNCGGGKTYWGTWVSCEETSSGQVHEVDPHVGTSSQKETVIGNAGGRYESFAYDARVDANGDRSNPTFYVTHDSSSGGLVRFTPDPAVVTDAIATEDYSNMLTHDSGVLHWLVLVPSDGTRYATSGSIQWTSNRSESDSNANLYYRSSEGIDIRNGIMYFTTKYWKDLFIVDLDNMTYTRSGTQSGAFDGQPDQIQRILAEDEENDMLYFCEEASSDNGIHARDQDGNFYTIIDGGDYSAETSGLAFSPDNKHMYVSYQSNGLIFDITRDDGYAFGAHRLDIKYHAV